MSKSYERVNYALRPAKNIERKMFCEVFYRLAEFGRVDSYRYIGFGSTYFSDFSLFHKSLKISNNVSIEREVVDKERFEFNLPYKCIKLIFGESNAILPTLDWSVRTIIWLDYDSQLSQSILTDVVFVCSNAPSGSILIVTVDADPDEMEERIPLLTERVGKLKLPSGWSKFKLGDWGTANAYRQIINNEINSTLRDRNGVLQSGSKIKYKQLFNFHYADGAKMLTVGGLLYDEGQSGKLASCEFENLDFVRTEDEAYKIEVPSLTLKEIRHLDKQLPCENLDLIISPSIPLLDIEKYAKIYRYFPIFVDAEIG